VWPRDHRQTPQTGAPTPATERWSYFARTARELHECIYAPHRVRQGRITISDLPALLRAVAEPRGVRGLTRSLIALLIVVLAAMPSG